VARGLGFSGLIRKTVSFNLLLRHTRGCGGSILTRILMGPLSVAFYDTQGDKGMWRIYSNPDLHRLNIWIRKSEIKSEIHVHMKCYFQFHRKAKRRTVAQKYRRNFHSMCSSSQMHIFYILYSDERLFINKRCWECKGLYLKKKKCSKYLHTALCTF
jgi:hypothetical protein